MRVAPLVVVLLAATAGCAGLAGEQSEATVTPAPVPEPTPTETGSAVAPGVGGGEVVDTRRLADAHVEAIRGRSYNWSETANATTLDGNATERTAISRRLRVETERRYRLRVVASWRPGNVSEFGTNQSRYRRHGGVRQQRYGTLSPVNVTEEFGARPEQVIRRYLAIGNATVAATRIDGERYYRVTGTTDSIPVRGTLLDYGVEAVVAPTGFVRELTVEYESEIDGERRRIRYHFRYTAVDSTTVSPPDWVADRRSENATVSRPD